ncbi:DNA-binding protein [Pseudonocardia sp. Cha107L01]|uniref:DNA-binding protein n=1 Tax=Pseudonocardia sp. Cha107L01 TaxID=3457576 RepID=UPI00403EB04A
MTQPPATISYPPSAAQTLNDLRQGPPTLDIPTACRWIGISKAHGYAIAAKGDFPAKVIRVGASYRVITASLIRLLEGADAA